MFYRLTRNERIINNLNSRNLYLNPIYYHDDNTQCKFIINNNSDNYNRHVWYRKVKEKKREYFDIKQV